MKTNLLLGLIFAGIFQGIVLAAFILLRRKYANGASIYLGLLILSFTLSNLQYTLEDMGVVSWELFNLIYLPYLFLAAPLLYFFVTQFLYPNRKSKLREKLLYVPFLVFLAITLIYKCIALTTHRTANNDLFQEDLANTIDFYGDFINIPLILISIIASVLMIRSYERQQLTYNLRVVKEELLWLKILLYILTATMIPWLIYTYAYLMDETIVYLPAFVIASLIIYLIGYIGIHKINILEQRREIRSVSKNQHTFSIIEKTQNTHIASIEKIILKEKKYLDPNFSLDALAKELTLSKSYLSRIINTEMNTNFSEYINTLRIEEAKKHLKNPEFSKYTLVAIGLESGFNSKTTFNTTFKRYTGQTPSQFKKNKLN